MTRIKSVFINVTSIILMMIFTQYAQASGLLKPKSAQFKDLQIEKHVVDVVVEDTYATTSIEQEFYNPNDADLETIYSFPVPKDAVVGEFVYWINGQPIVAEAVEKQKAKQIYQEQKAQGNSVALAEKDSFKTFDITVYPVPAKQSVKIRLVYMQDVKLDHGVGRYVYPMEEGGVDDQRDAFWSRNDKVESLFSFDLTVKSSYPIDAVRLPKHSQAVVNNPQNGVWTASFSNQNEESESVTQQAYRLNQDIVAYWRHIEGLPGRLEVVTYRDPKTSSKGTVKLTFTPGDDLSAINANRDWVFILDRSGSMDGKFSTLIEGVRQGLSRLPTQDRFKVITFNEGAYELTSGFISVNEQNVNRTLERVESEGVGGGTNLYAGLQEGLHQLDSDRPTGVILVTDGVANVGVTEKEEFLTFLAKKDVRLFTFVMGNSANEPLLQSMTKVSNGFSQNVSNSDDIQGQLMQATSKITHQAYRNIQVDIDGVKVKDLTPDDIQSLYRGEQLSLFGHYFKSGIATVTLTANNGVEEKSYSSKVNFPETALLHPELERLWAFSTIKDMLEKMDYLGEEDADTKQAIVDVALDYGLLTDFTSLLVVEEQVFEQLSIEQKNKRRVEIERKAKEQRSAQQVTPVSVDDQQPMFTSPAPSSGSSGGGSLGHIGLLVMGSLLFWRRTKRKV
jgi:Ca-activated chloride channel family protein